MIGPVTSMDLLRNSRNRRIAVGIVALGAAAIAGLALVVNRPQSAQALIFSAVLFIAVEVIFTLNGAARSAMGGIANSESMRFGSLAGALFFWALAALLFVLGIFHMFQP
jgi:hypothetical protein